MFLFTFGLFWTIFSLVFLGLMVGMGGSEVPTFAYIMIGVFIAIGIFMLIKGLKKLIQNYKTNKYGEICYGQITNVYPDGSYVNGAPEYQADVLTYITREGKTETISEIIGFNPHKYQVNSYVKVKYYNGDINIEEVLSSINDIPMSIQSYFKAIDNNNNSNQSDIIVVNGVKYKRID